LRSLTVASIARADWKSCHLLLALIPLPAGLAVELDDFFELERDLALLSGNRRCKARRLLGERL
jgi:hypothetical protein